MQPIDIPLLWSACFWAFLRRIFQNAIVFEFLLCHRPYMEHFASIHPVISVTHRQGNADFRRLNHPLTDTQGRSRGLNVQLEVFLTRKFFSFSEFVSRLARLRPEGTKSADARTKVMWTHGAGRVGRRRRPGNECSGWEKEVGMENVSTCRICGLGSQCESYMCLYSGIVGTSETVLYDSHTSKKLFKAWRVIKFRVKRDHGVYSGQLFTF